MAISARIESIDQDIQLIFSEDLSGPARSKILAEFAGEVIEEARQTNKQVFGVVPPHTVTVDGREGAPLSAVKPDGVIVAEFELVSEALVWINTQLQKHSPVLEGKYVKSHELFADGVEIDNPSNPPPARRFVFLNTRPYARKIERGQSSDAPDGVYQVVAKLARGRFGNVAKISFSYETALSGSIVGGREGNRSSQRQPAIIVTLGDQ